MSETAATENPAEYVRLSVAARRLDFSPAALIAAIERGELKGFRLGTRGHWRLEAASLEQAIERSGS